MVREAPATPRRDLDQTAAVAGPDSERIDALRRGLYRPGATEEDLRRYLDERGAVAPAEPATAPPPAPTRRRWPVIAASAGLGLAVVGALTLALGYGAPGRIAPTPSASAGAPQSVVMDVGDGQILAVPADGRTTSVATPSSVRGRPVVGELFTGSGNAVVSVDPPADPLSGGSAVLVFRSIDGVPASWRVLSTLRLGRAFSGPMVLARGASPDLSGATDPQTFGYQAESPPARIAVAAPEGARWSVLIAVAGEEQALR
jgi:hypothetical protein